MIKDPFFVVSALYPNTPSPAVLYNSETKPQTLNPEFQAFKLELAQTRDWDNTIIVVDVFDFDASGQHDFIGTFKTTLRELSVSKKSYPLINQFKKDRYQVFVM
jgi:Ca2+-dependent lipid-binding protein